MPAERRSMKKIRDVLRLTHTMGLSRRRVSEATGIGRTAISDYVAAGHDCRARVAAAR